MKNIDFYNINEDRVFSGDIEMVVGINQDKFNELKEMGIKDYFLALSTIPAKNGVTLIKIKEDTYIDFDTKKFDYINYCIDNNIMNDNNLFLKTRPNNPYIGQLVVTNIERLDKKLTLK